MSRYLVYLKRRIEIEVEADCGFERYETSACLEKIAKHHLREAGMSDGELDLYEIENWARYVGGGEGTQGAYR